MDIINNVSLDKSRNSFVLRKLKKIFFNWNIVFFKFLNLRKNKIQIIKINLYKNTFMFFFKNIKNLNLLYKVNKNIWDLKLNVLSINFNGFYLNYNIMKKWKFSNNIFEKIYINLFIKLICGLVIKILLNLLLKSLFFFKYNFININLQKKCLNI